MLRIKVLLFLQPYTKTANDTSDDYALHYHREATTRKFVTGGSLMHDRSVHRQQ